MKISVPCLRDGKGVETWFPLGVESRLPAVAAASAVDWQTWLQDGLLCREFFDGEGPPPKAETWLLPAAPRTQTASRGRPAQCSGSLCRRRALGVCFRRSPAARDGGPGAMTRPGPWKPGFHSCATLSGRKFIEDKMPELNRFTRPVATALETASPIPWGRLQNSKPRRETLITLRQITLPVTTWSTAHV